MLDSQYTPESARSGKPSGRARKSTLGAFLREHLTDIIEVRQRPHGQHEIVATGAPNTNGAGMHNNAGMHTNVTGVQQVANDQYGAFRADLQQQTWAHQETPEEHIRALILKQQRQQQLQQQQHLRQLRNALSQATVGAPGGIPAYDSPLPFDVNGPLMGVAAGQRSSDVRAGCRSSLPSQGCRIQRGRRQPPGSRLVRS